MLVRPALWFCACNLLAAALAAQCSNPTQVTNGTFTSGDHSVTDNIALSASNFAISGSATATMVAGNCIQLLPGFHANAIGATVPTTFHAWVETAPAAVSVLPPSGSGLSQAFTWTVSSPSGYSNLSEVQALFSTSTSGANACYIKYNRASNLLSVADNSGSNWSPGILPGSSDTTGGFSPNCTVNGIGSSVTPSGTQLTLTTSVTFQPAFAGTKNRYLIAYDNAGLNTVWQQFGTWTVSNPSGFTPIRISSGGPYTDSHGQVWSPDSGYVLQSLGTWGTNAAIGNTTDPQLYKMERYNYPGALTYQFSVPSGEYTVTLKFAEIYDGTTGPGQRNMNVAINGMTVTTGLDVWTAAHGKYIAYDLPFQVSVANGVLTITLTCTNNSAEVNAIEIVARSAPQQYSLTTSLSPPGGGSTTPSCPGGCLYNNGTPVTITATPAAGYQFTGFSGSLTGGSPGYVTMVSNKSVTANFTQTVTSYSLTTSVSPSGSGTLTFSPPCCTYNAGTQVTITATPASGYQFNGWTGSVNGSFNPLTVTMNSAMTETANFTPVSTQYQLTTSVSPSAGGTLTFNPTCCTYNAGTQVQITAAAASGYQFTGFTGSVSSGANPLTVTMSSAVTETATFAPTGTTLTISTQSLATGAVQAAYSQTLSASGGTPPYSWSIAAGSLPAGLALSGGVISGTPTTAGSYSFTVRVTDSASQTVTAAFSLSIASGALLTMFPAYPSGGAYSIQPFTFTVSDPVSATNISNMTIAFQSATGSPVTGTCTWTYNPATNVLSYAEAQVSSGPYFPGTTTGTIGGPLCSTNMGLSAAAVSGRDLTLQLTVYFATNFNINVFASAQTSTGPAGPTQVGQWSSGSAAGTFQCSAPKSIPDPPDAGTQLVKQVRRPQ